MMNSTAVAETYFDGERLHRQLLARVLSVTEVKCEEVGRYTMLGVPLSSVLLVPVNFFRFPFPFGSL